MGIALTRFDAVADEMAKLYDKAEMQMKKIIASQLYASQPERDWNRAKLDQTQQVRQRLRDVMQVAAATREAKQVAAINNAYSGSSLAFIREAKQFTDTSNMTRLSPNSFKVAAILFDLQEKMNATNRVILRQADDAYANAIARSSALVATGTYTRRQATNQAVIELAKQNIGSFVDKAGRTWEMSAYCEMATRTAVERATLYGYVDTMQEYGFDLAMVSSHVGACPLCGAWEGVVISVSGASHEYPSLDDAMGAGLFHPNCLHDISTYYEGVSKTPRHAPSNSPGQSSVAYEARQTQRYYERQMRKYSEIQQLVRDPVAELRAYKKVKEYDAKLDGLVDSYNDQYFKGNGVPNSDRLYRHKDREGTIAELSSRAKQLQANAIQNASASNGQQSVPVTSKLQDALRQAAESVMK